MPADLGVTLAEDERRELERLRLMDEEYHKTLQVTACLVERLMAAEEVSVIVVTDEHLSVAPDLIAHRDDSRGRITLTATRQ